MVSANKRWYHYTNMESKVFSNLYVLSGQDEIRDSYDGGIGYHDFSRIVRGVSSLELMQLMCHPYQVKRFDFANAERFTLAGEERKRKEKAYAAAVKSGIDVLPLPTFVDNTPVRLYLVRGISRVIEGHNLIPNSRIVYADSLESAGLAEKFTSAILLENAWNDISSVPVAADEAQANALLREHVHHLQHLRESVVNKEKKIQKLESLISSLNLIPK